MDAGDEQRAIAFMKKYELSDSTVNDFLEKKAFEYRQNSTGITKARQRYRTFKELHASQENVSREAFMDERKSLDELAELENKNHKIAAVFKDFIPQDFVVTIVLPVKGSLEIDKEKILAFTVKRDPGSENGIQVSALS
jgi:hypothetical protein